MKKFLAAVLALVLVLSCAPAVLAAEPDAPLTRGEALEMLLNAADNYNPGVQKSDILQGYPDGGLHEEESVTYLQALLMLERAFGGLPEPTGAYVILAYDASNFTDIPDWAAEELANVLQSGIAVGSSDTTLNPDALLTRGQMETLIRRVYALEGSNLKDDFYFTVNHEYLTTTELEPGLPWHDPLADLSYQSLEDVDAIVSEILETGGTTDAEKRIVVFYNNFMDWDGRNAAGLAPIRTYLDAIDAASTAEELLAVDIQIAEEQGAPVLIAFDTVTSLEDATKIVLTFEPYLFFLSRGGYAVEGVQKEAYLNLAARLLELSGETPEEAQRQAQLCWDTESALAEAQLGLQDAKDVTIINNQYTMEQLQALFPSADLPALLAAQKLKAEATYRVEELELAEVCGALFQDENLDALKALLRFGLLRTAGNYLTQDIYNEMMVYQVSAQAGVLVTSDRVKENAENLDTLYASMARNLIKDLMSVYLEETYVDRRFSAEAKADMEKMLRELIAVFRQRVENLDWMSDATKEGAFRKLDAMTLHVAYPDEWDTTINNATIAPVSEGGSAYQNWVELQKAQQDKKAAQQGVPVDNSGWHYQVYTANAGYNPQANLIEVPAGILQAPLYDVEASYEENLGGIGYVLAHEISHAFDNNGANYDEKGNAVNWWTEEDYAAFQALCREVVEYYDGRECAPGITCDGTQTLSENIADIGALACITQIVSQQENPDFETLYRTAAKTWRTVVTRNTLELSKHTDIHAPDALRGQLPLQTCDEFYETFGITEGDGMWIPPEQRISIW